MSPLPKTSTNATHTPSKTNVSFSCLGDEYTVSVWPLTWLKQKRAQDAATTYHEVDGKWQYRRDMGKLSLAVLKEVVADSTIPGIPGNSWETLRPEVGDAMYEAVMSHFEPSDDEVAEAKKSQGATASTHQESSASLESLDTQGPVSLESPSETLTQ